MKNRPIDQLPAGNATAPVPRAAKAVYALLTAGGVVLAFWIGGSVSDRAVVAMAASVLLVLGVGVFLVVVARRRRELAFIVLPTYLAVAAAAGGFLLWTSTRDVVVNEQVETVASAAPNPGPNTTHDATTNPPGVSAVTPLAAASSAVSSSTSSTPSTPRVAARVSGGEFVAGAHPTTGTATVIRRADGSVVIALTSFSTSPGPDLRIRVLDAQGKATDLANLKGNKGDQQYALAGGVDPAAVRAVQIWCRSFTVAFGTAAVS